MRILQINAVYRQLSTGRSIFEMNKAFCAQGHEAVVAYSTGVIENPEKEHLIGGRLGQKAHAVLSRLTGLQGYFSSFSTAQLIRFMDKFQPEVVMLGNLHANYIHLPMLLKYLAKKDIPTVAVLHDCWFYTGKCCHYTVAGCYRWQESCGSCPSLKKYNKSWFFDRSTKMLRDKMRYFGAIPRLGVVAVSDWLLREAKQAPVFQNAAMMKRIYNWIDTEQFAPGDSSQLRQEMGLTGKKVILCVAGAWDQSKGLDTVMRIAENLKQQEHLIVVGGLPADTVFPERVTHIPRTDSVKRLVALYNLADVFVQPSLEETFGKVSAEALCCGTPVVCFNSTANPELVGPGCGAVVPAGDIDGMLAQIRKLYAVEKAQYTEPCRSLARERFNMQTNIKEYSKFLEQLTTIHSEER